MTSAKLIGAQFQNEKDSRLQKDMVSGFRDSGLWVARLVLTALCICWVMAAAAWGQSSAQAGGKSAEQPASRRYINLPNRPVQAPFSDGVLVGNTLYVAGRIGIDTKTGKAPEDVGEEIKLLLDGIRSVLQEAEMTMDDLVMVQVFCPDLSLYDKFNAAYRGYFGKDYPARAFVGSGPLLRGGHFEMMGIAVKK